MKEIFFLSNSDTAENVQDVWTKYNRNHHHRMTVKWKTDSAMGRCTYPRQDILLVRKRTPFKVIEHRLFDTVKLEVK